MKKILLVSPYYLTRKEVGGAFTYQFISKLINKGVYVDYISFKYDGDIEDPPLSENFRIIRSTRLTKLDKYLSWLQCPIYHPLFTSRFSWKLVFTLNDLIKKVNYDYLVFDYSQTFTLAHFVKHPHKILIAHDIISQRFEREHSRLLKWIRWTECKLLGGVEKIYSFSRKDCELVNQRYKFECDVTPVFIKDDILGKQATKIEDYHVFFADWGRTDNSESLEWFMSHVIDRLPDVKIKVIGGNLPDYLRERIKKHKNVEYLGFVDDPYQLIANARSEISPLHKGAGIKVKCLESLACGTPVIGTEIAFEGIDSRFGYALHLANTPDDYVVAINSVKLSLIDKINLKKDFIENYSQRSIVEYIIDN